MFNRHEAGLFCAYLIRWGFFLYKHHYDIIKLFSLFYSPFALYIKWTTNDRKEEFSVLQCKNLIF